MCGICGQVLFNGATPSADSIAAMCQEIAHRGPDDRGIYTAPYIGLGQTRLSIIDLLPTATAPLSNEDGTVWVTLNGEIYNYVELRSELTARGHRFRTLCDTEVVVHLYEEYGTGCLERMRGMFSFALWDAGRRRLFAARDRLGKKPFCYARTSAGFLFGSEIKAITADPRITVSPNYFALDQYLTYQYVPSPLTAFAGVNRLPAAHYLTCTASGDVRIERYWSRPSPAECPDDGDVDERLVSLLREAVRLRLRADVPIGAFLSGGVDSSLVVALMAEESGKAIKTFSIGFGETAYDERPFARMVARQYHTDHHEFVLTADAGAILPELVRFYNEPFADSSAVPTYYVSKLTRQHVTVALSGDGGDESFSGYNRYGELLRWGRMDAFPKGLRSGFTALGRLFDWAPHRPALARLSRAMSLAGGSLPDRYVLQMSHVKPQERQALYTNQFRAWSGNRPEDYAGPAGFPWRDSMDPVDWMMAHDQNFYLPDCLMVKTDIASMANSLEIRCPLLDHKVVEFAVGIPSARKRRNRQGKLILKRIAKRMLPAAVIDRKKMGFGIPQGQWLRNGLADPMRELLLGDRFVRRGLFHRDAVAGMVRQHCEGKRDWSNRLWALLMLELWFREFID